jgi:hypothetical protein
VALLFHAAARPQAVGSPSIALQDDGPVEASGKRAVAEGHDLVFRYRDRAHLEHGRRLDEDYFDILGQRHALWVEPRHPEHRDCVGFFGRKFW